MGAGVSATQPLISRLQLPRLTRAEATFARARYAHRAALALPGGQFHLALGTQDARGRDPEPVRVSLRWGDETLTLACPAELLREVLRSLDDGSLDRGLTPETVPPDLAGLLVEAALTPMIEAWEQASGRSVAVLGLERDGPETSLDGLDLLVTEGERVGSGRAWPLRLACGSQAEAALLASWPVVPRGADRLGLPAALRLGATRLPRRVLASLRPGDAVLLETRTSGPDSAVLVIAESWTALARRGTGDEWQLAEEPRPAQRQGRGIWTMDGDDLSARPAAVADLDAIPVTLTFEVGRLEVPLGELRRMGPGSVLELGRGMGELVEIAAHGRPIGRGELVEVDGAVAVRIVRLFDHG